MEAETTHVPILELRGATKVYGHVVALDGVNLEAYPGRVLAIVGDNGAGKSTLLKVLAGVHQMDSGELRFNGEPTSIASPAAAQALGIATVFQNLALVECLDVAANMYLGTPIRRAWFFADRGKMIEGAADVLRGLRIRIPSVRVPVGVLSGGQRQGVAIARAVRAKSSVVLMDEPTAALGYRETQQVLEVIRGLRDSGKAVIIISHDLELVFSVADEILVMRLGRVTGVRQRMDVSRDDIVSMITGSSGLEQLDECLAKESN